MGGQFSGYIILSALYLGSRRSSSSSKGQEACISRLGSTRNMNLSSGIDELKQDLS